MINNRIKRDIKYFIMGILAGVVGNIIVHFIK
jgi:hypothetical protein